MMPESVLVNGVRMGPVAFNGLRLNPVLHDLFVQLTSFDLTSHFGGSIRMQLEGALMGFNERVGRAIFGYSPVVEAYFAATRGAVVTKEQVGFRPYLPGMDNPVCYALLLNMVGDLTLAEFDAELGISDERFDRMLAAPEEASEHLRSKVHLFLVSRKCHLPIAERRYEEFKTVWPVEARKLAAKLQGCLDWIATIPPRYRRELGRGRLPAPKGRSRRRPKDYDRLLQLGVSADDHSVQAPVLRSDESGRCLLAPDVADRCGRSCSISRIPLGGPATPCRSPRCPHATIPPADAMPCTRHRTSSSSESRRDFDRPAAACTVLIPARQIRPLFAGWL